MDIDEVQVLLTCFLCHFPIIERIVLQSLLVISDHPVGSVEKKHFNFLDVFQFLQLSVVSHSTGYLSIIQAELFIKMSISNYSL